MNAPQPANPRVRPIELGVTWAPNVPNSMFFAGDRGEAELWLLPHFNDVDQSWVVLHWLGFCAARVGPYNDEALDLHPLYEFGLSDIFWAGEASDTPWLAEVRAAVAARIRPSLRHFLVLSKESIVEIVATRVEVERSPVPPVGGWMHDRLRT